MNTFAFCMWMTKDTFLTQLMLRVEGGSKDLLAVNVERVVECALFLWIADVTLVN